MRVSQSSLKRCDSGLPLTLQWRQTFFAPDIVDDFEDPLGKWRRRHLELLTQAGVVHHVVSGGRAAALVLLEADLGFRQEHSAHEVRERRG